MKHTEKNKNTCCLAYTGQNHLHSSIVLN